MNTRVTPTTTRDLCPLGSGAGFLLPASGWLVPAPTLTPSEIRPVLTGSEPLSLEVSQGLGEEGRG